ncbi:MAG: SDR family oxidoreductase [Desulfobacterium sp.]|nr:SDR family oxidoreductase [Desulfobacterium sp.]
MPPSGQNNQPSQKPVVVTGATGYVAGRLIPLLLESGYTVRAMGRSLEKLMSRHWADHARIQLAQGDIGDIESLKRAVRGSSTVYYLVHSMISQKGKYRDADKIGAKNMAEAAAAEGVESIIYLGGLGDITHKNISRHLISRNEVGEILAHGPVPVTVLRAAMILGSGSASFEIVRYLVERLPVMITPKWVTMPTQPIAITNVLGYLKGCLEHPETRGRTFDIGGPDIVSYRDLFYIFAKVAGLPRPLLIPVPVLSPKFSALWIHIITPVPAAIAGPLTQGLSIPTTCTENSITTIIDQDLITCEDAIKRALDHIRRQDVPTCWTDAGSMRYPELTHCTDSSYSGGTVLTCGFRAKVRGTPWDLWPALEKLCGKERFYTTTRLWRLRGLMDRFTGGPGLKRGRRSDKRLRPGDTLDFWRVLKIAPPGTILLADEMRMPGQAQLEIGLTPLAGLTCEITILSHFLPKGLAGIGYWYLFYPFQHYVYAHLLKDMVRVAGVEILSGPERFTPIIQRVIALHRR